MKIDYITKGIITTILLFFMMMNVAFAQSTSLSSVSPKSQVKKETTGDEKILFFPIIGETQSDFQRFESKVNQAEFLGLTEAKIDPKSKK